MILHNRLDPRLLDQMAQPHQHGEAKYRGCADPSRLRGSMYVNVCQARHGWRRAVLLRIIVTETLCERVNLLRYAMACDACTRGWLRKHPLPRVRL
jgi:hypothetical protein